MKIKHLFSVSLLAFATTTFAQSDIPVPEFKNKVQMVSADNSLINLDGVDMQSDMKSGIGNAKIYLRAEGAKSVLKQDGVPGKQYIIKLDEGVDPEVAVELFKLETDKRSRFILVTTYNMGTSKTPTMNKVKLNFKKLQPSVYAISYDEQLPAGEYAFIVNRPAVSYTGSANVKVYTFSVGN